MQHPRIFKIGVIHRLAPIVGFCPLEQRAQTLALHTFGNFNACKIQNRRREIHIHHQRIGHIPADTPIWITHHQRNANRRLVHKPLIVPSVIAQKIPVIRRVNHQRIVSPTRLIQIIQHPPQIFIHTVNRAIPILHKTLINPILLFPITQALGYIVIIGRQTDIKLHIFSQSRNFSRGKIIAIRLRLGNLNIFKKMRVPRGWRKRPMRRLKLIHQTKRLLTIQILQKFKRHIRRYIRSIPLLYDFFPIIDIRRIKIHALPGMNTPRIKPARILSDMILAKQRGLVPLGLKQFGKRRHIRIQILNRIGPLGISPNTVNMRKTSRQHRTPRRRAQRIGRKTIVKPRTLIPNAIQIGRMQNRIAITAHLARRVVIGHHKQNIRSLHLHSFTGYQQKTSTRNNTATSQPSAWAAHHSLTVRETASRLPTTHLANRNPASRPSLWHIRSSH